MKHAITAVLFTGALLMSAPVSAAELKGAELVEALNGKSFRCSWKKSTMDWTFAKSDPNGKKFPYVVKLGSRTVKQAYRLHKNGTMRHNETNKTRKIVRNDDGSFTVSGNGIPTERCVYR